MAAVCVPIPAPAKKKPARDVTGGTITVVLWQKPADIRSRNLFYGPGGAKDEPHGPFTFLKEDLKGTNPKFTVRDRDGVKWTVKLGVEARSETVASRLIWAAGYFTTEDYLVRVLRVEHMPARLTRGQELIAPGGSMHDARLKRSLEGFEKIGDWEWRHVPFAGTREWNGLRVMMALVNNWDLKDDNNAVYERKSGGRTTRIFLVSDLGSTFGTSGNGFTRHAKGNLHAYSRSKFILSATPEYVDFAAPGRPDLLNPRNLIYFFSNWRHVAWVGKHIPREDARWIGKLLAQLSPAQIRDAFRAGGYPVAEVEEFSADLAKRIDALKEL